MFLVEEVVEAIQKAGGIISATARILGCSRSTVENYIKRHPEVAEAVRAEREKMIDLAEGVLISKLRDNDLNAAKFVLNTLGKKRGYSERPQISIDEAGIRIVIQRPELPESDRTSVLEDGGAGADALPDGAIEALPAGDDDRTSVQPATDADDDRTSVLPDGALGQDSGTSVRDKVKATRYQEVKWKADD
jgi:hypothetical protein